MAAIVTASESNRVIQAAQLAQVMDQITVPGRKWFSLQDNKLDGTYHPIDDAGAEQVGWWSNVLSTTGGVISSPPVLTITETRSIHALRVSGDSLLNEFPVDFTVKLYNGAAVLYTETVVGNDSVTWSKTLATTYDVTKIEVTVTKINKASRVVKLTDAFSPFDIVRTDALTPMSTEVSSQSGLFYAYDDVTVASELNESSSTEVNVYGTDGTNTVLTESSFFTLYEIWREEALSALTIDESTPVSSDLTVSDNVSVDVSAVNTLDISLVRVESIIVGGNIEEDLITASFDSTSVLSVKLDEATTLTNVHTKMDESYRQTFAKVEVTYTDPFLDDTIEITASSTAHGTNAIQLADNVEKAAYKWFSLSDNKLDGTYNPIDGTGQLSVGWWGLDISDSSGEFVVPQTIEVTFEPRSLYYLKLSGDNKLNNYPVDFTITCYDSLDDVIQTYSVVGNTETTWYLTITPLVNVAKIVLEVFKINKPYDNVKLTEFFTSVVETYYDNDLVNIDLLEELAYPNGSITLGAISSNEIDVVFDNSKGKFNLGNAQSLLYNLIKRNRRLKAWLGTEIIPGTIEWYPLGVFWTLGWDIKEDTLEAKTTARDRLELLRFSDFTISQVYENYTLYQLFELVLNDAELYGEAYNISSALNDIIIPYAWFDRCTHREALQRLASCAYIQVYCDRLGVIQVGSIDTSGQPIVTFKDSTNIYTKSYPITSTEITNYVEVATSLLTVKGIAEVLRVTETIIVPANDFVEVTYRFNAIPSKNVQLAAITCDPGIDVEFTSYAWGCTLKYINNTGISQSFHELIVEGQYIENTNQSYVVAKDDALIRDNGKIKVDVSHDFIQTSAYALSLANTLLDAYKQSLYDVSIQSRGDIGLYIGHKTQVLSDTEYMYITQRQNITWNGALSVQYEGKKI